MEYDVSSTCPKCNLEEETPNHHVGDSTYYQALRKKVFGQEKTTTKSVVENQIYIYRQSICSRPEDLLNTASSKLNKCESDECCNEPKLRPTQCACEG